MFCEEHFQLTNSYSINHKISFLSILTNTVESCISILLPAFLLSGFLLLALFGLLCFLTLLLRPDSFLQLSSSVSKSLPELNVEFILQTNYNCVLLLFYVILIRCVICVKCVWCISGCDTPGYNISQITTSSTVTLY